MKQICFIVLLCVSTHLVAQEKLYPLKYNAQQFRRTNTLKTRSDSDSVNQKFTIIDLVLPFFDDFSTDKRFPKDLTPYFRDEYYVEGDCKDVVGSKIYDIAFSTSQTYIDTYDPVTQSKVSTPTNPVKISKFDTDCISPISTFTLFPALWNYEFDANGKKIDSVFTYDTIINSAWVKEYLIKDKILWYGDDVYINDHYAYLPYSKGVATLDGLKGNGRPYEPSVFDAYGPADIFTSREMNISGVTRSDSLYLSFLLQLQGFGDWPNHQDSLVLEFKDKNKEWHQIASYYGVRDRIDSVDLVFNHYNYYVPPQNVIDEPNYYHDSFQFRFRNYATLTGNNDHWHLDFVRLDTARTYDDTVIKDANFVYELSSILKNYTLLPAKQFIGSDDLKDTLVAVNRNLLESPILSTYNYKCENLNTFTNYYQTPSGVPYRANPLVFVDIPVIDKLNIPSTIEDSTFIKTTIYLDQSDNIVTNDTASGVQFFFNEIAYDDGTAERAYGVEGVGIKKVAYKFILNKPDTLAAIKIMFSHIDKNVSGLLFNINVWKSIGIDGQSEVELASYTNLKPQYIDTLNSFFTFGLEKPVLVEDSFYIGWTQADEDNLQIGYDMNTPLGLPNLYKFTNNIWSRSNISEPGSPMLRAILDGTRDYSVPGTSKIVESKLPETKIVLYPNPATDYVKFDYDGVEKLDIIIYDMVGRVVLKTQERKNTAIDISTLLEGNYIINFYKDGGKIQSEKFLINK